MTPFGDNYLKWIITRFSFRKLRPWGAGVPGQREILDIKLRISAAVTGSLLAGDIGRSPTRPEYTFCRLLFFRRNIASLISQSMYGGWFTRRGEPLGDFKVPSEIMNHVGSKRGPQGIHHRQNVDDFLSDGAADRTQMTGGCEGHADNAQRHAQSDPKQKC